MTLLVLGLIVFLGVHSSRVFAEPWRLRAIERLGANGWKGLYSLASVAGFAMIVWGYGQARLDPVALWTPMVWTRHLAALLTVPAFVLLFAAYVPGNAIKARLHHPMVLAVKVWALAHLLANNTAADLMLFGSFLVWSILVYRAARRRQEPAPRPGTAAGTALTVIVGAAAWAGFAFWLHGIWIGVRPLG